MSDNVMDGSTSQKAKEDHRPALGMWCPGEYLNQCWKCHQFFVGDKRSTECADCVYSDGFEAYDRAAAGLAEAEKMLKTNPMSREVRERADDCLRRVATEIGRWIAINRPPAKDRP